MNQYVYHWTAHRTVDALRALGGCVRARKAALKRRRNHRGRLKRTHIGSDIFLAERTIKHKKIIDSFNPYYCYENVNEWWEDTEEIEWEFDPDYDERSWAYWRNKERLDHGLPDLELYLYELLYELDD